MMSIIFSHRSLVIWLAGCAQAWFAAGACAEAADWQIDPDHFSIAFEAEHIGYQQQLGFSWRVRVSSALIPRQMYSAVGVLKFAQTVCSAITMPGTIISREGIF